MASLFLCQVPSNAGRKEIPSVPKVRVCVPGTGERERECACTLECVCACLGLEGEKESVRVHQSACVCGSVWERKWL